MTLFRGWINQAQRIVILYEELNLRELKYQGPASAVLPRAVFTSIVSIELYIL